jgi:hypothetical protein
MRSSPSGASVGRGSPRPLRRRGALLLVLAGAIGVPAAAAIAPGGGADGRPSGGSLQLVRTQTLKLPNDRITSAGFAAGKTYLVRLSGSVSFAGAPLGIDVAPGAFTINSVGNDVVLASLPRAGLAVPGQPGARQIAVQLDPAGNALRYNLESRSCSTLPEQPALPGTSLELRGGPPSWSGSVRVDVYAYGSGGSTPSSPPPVTAAQRFATTATASGTIFARDATKYVFSFQGSDYRASSVQIALSAVVAETLGTEDKNPKIVSGSATVVLTVVKIRGTGPARLSQNLRYRLTSVDDLDSSATGQAFAFKGALVGAGPAPCKKLDFYADREAGLANFRVCSMDGDGRATARITPVP